MIDGSISGVGQAAVAAESWRTIPIGDEWSSTFRSFTSTASRLETLQEYAEPNESGPFHQYLKGIVPPPSWTEEWCNMVENHVASGRSMRRIHVVDLPLSDYMRFEIKCCYVYTGASGENIRLVDRASLSPEERAITQEDFWLFDGSMVMVNDYDQTGSLYQARVSMSPEIVSRYVNIQSRIWACGVPFVDFFREVTGESLELIQCGSRKRRE
jgi:hypothetical protein